jgi:hypothetical protein
MLSTGTCLSANVDSDPLMYQVELPFHATYYPMGYAVELSTNSPDALEVAAKLWRRYPALSHASPVRIRVIRGDSDAPPFREPARARGQGHLLSIIHGPQDYAVADLTSGFAFALLSRLSISQPSYFRYHFLEPLTYVLLAARHFALVHASCVSLNGRAIVLCGASGSGKTCLAYSCAKRGWKFISGDAVHIVRGRDDHMVIGRPYEIRFRDTARELFPELGSVVPEPRPNGKVDLELDTSELGISVALHAVAHDVVFLERARVTAIERYDRDDAVERLKETICFGDDRSRLEQRASLEHLSGLPLWRLSYSDPASAEALLRLVVNGAPVQ